MEEQNKRRKNPAILAGQRIKERIVSRDEALGGIVVEILGVQGSGKTSLLLSIVNEIKKNKTEHIFWRESTASQCQFNRFKHYKIFAIDGLNIEFKNVLNNKTENISVTHFNDFNELMQLSKPEKINVIYLKNNMDYVGFIKFLRLYPGWQSFFIDEYEDLAPLRASGETWHNNEELSQEFKNIRRGLVSVFCSTQTPSDVDWRVRSKIMCHVYLNGSKVDLMSPIDQSAVNALPIGQFFCDYGHAIYGKGSFLPYPPKKPVLISNIF